MERLDTRMCIQRPTKSEISRRAVRCRFLLAFMCVLGLAADVGSANVSALKWSHNGRLLVWTKTSDTPTSVESGQATKPRSTGVWLFRDNGALLRKVSARTDVAWWAGDARLAVGRSQWLGSPSESRKWAIMDLLGKEIGTIGVALAPDGAPEIDPWSVSPEGRYLSYLAFWPPAYGTELVVRRTGQYRVVLYSLGDMKAAGEQPISGTFSPPGIIDYVPPVV